MDIILEWMWDRNGYEWIQRYVYVSRGHETEFPTKHDSACSWGSESHASVILMFLFGLKTLQGVPCCDLVLLFSRSPILQPTLGAFNLLTPEPSLQMMEPATFFASGVGSSLQWQWRIDLNTELSQDSWRGCPNLWFSVQSFDRIEKWRFVYTTSRYLKLSSNILVTRSY